MSIFEENKFNNLNTELNEIINHIDWNKLQSISYSLPEGASFISPPSKEPISLNDILEKYSDEVVYALDGKQLLERCKNNLDFIELFYNIIVYWKKTKNKYLDNIPKWEKLLIYTKKILENNNYEFIEIEENKLKLISNKTEEIISQIEDKSWKQEISNYFCLDDSITKKEKTLGWFKGFLESERRDYLEKNNNILDKINSKKLWKIK